MTDFAVDKTSHSYLLGVAQYELSECHSHRDKLRRARVSKPDKHVLHVTRTSRNVPIRLTHTNAESH